MAKHQHALEKDAIKAQTVALIAQGQSDGQVAAALADQRLPVTRQAIQAFRHRHHEEIAELQTAVAERVTDLASGKEKIS